jgi:hypothetical protein
MTETMTLDDYKRLKNRIDAAKKEATKAQGVCSEILATLKKDFDVDDTDEARSLLSRLSKEKKEREERLQELLKEFEKQWGKQLAE